jgi:hypothetical protein
MIENVVKTPDLTAEQAKYLKYEVSYQNGESITTKQNLYKDTSMPIKVRIEYRRDLNNIDLPSGQVVLDLALTLEYVQSDGSGSSVSNNGVDVFAFGNEVCFSDECFYIIDSGEENATLFAKMNINDTFKQASSGTAISDYSKIDNYLLNYESYLSSIGVDTLETRLINYDELINFGCDAENSTCSGAPEWTYSSDYYVGSSDNNLICRVNGLKRLFCDTVGGTVFGVRPVIVVPKTEFR